MNTLEKVGRMSVNEVQSRRLFISFIVCKDQKGNLVVVGAGSPYFLHFRERTIQATKTEKVSMVKAIMSANRRGEMMPRPQDQVRTVPVVLTVVDTIDLNRSQPLDVYFYYI